MRQGQTAVTGPRVRALALCIAAVWMSACSKPAPEEPAPAAVPETAPTAAATVVPVSEHRDPLALTLPSGKPAPVSPEQYQQLARSLLAEMVAIDTTLSHGSTTRASEAVRTRLLAAGFAEGDVQVVTAPDLPERGNLVVKLAGSDPSLKPLLLLAHIDVVDANREDWTLPPFELIERNGAFYGRGVADDKDEAAIYIANLIRMKQEGFVPRRGIVVALTTEEETGEPNGVDLLLREHPQLVDAAFVFNEGGGGKLESDGRRVSNQVQAAEKKFLNYTLEVTDPGGHSSRPREDNPIRRLGAALSRISTTFVPVKLNPVSREYLRRTADLVGGEDGKQMAALAANDQDAAAIAHLSTDPGNNATIRTTCVPTLLQGGHAENALPQRATANVNCRLVPDDEPEFVLEQLRKVIADDGVKVTISGEATPSPPSPVEGQVLTAITRITEQMWPGVPVVPTMGTGATDSKYFRMRGVPSYGVSGLFYDETGAHGMNERVPVQSFYEGQEFLYRLVKDVSAE